MFDPGSSRITSKGRRPPKMKAGFCRVSKWARFPVNRFPRSTMPRKYPSQFVLEEVP